MTWIQLTRPLLALSTIGALLLGAATVGAADRPLPLQAVARVALPGASVRFDYTSIDPASHRLYIAHMDADELLVFDLQTRRVIKQIHAPGVHGVIAVPALDRVYASATNDHQALTINARTNAVLARAPAGATPTASPTTRPSDTSSSPTRTAAWKPC